MSCQNNADTQPPQHTTHKQAITEATHTFHPGWDETISQDATQRPAAKKDLPEITNSSEPANDTLGSEDVTQTLISKTMTAITREHQATDASSIGTRIIGNNSPTPIGESTDYTIQSEIGRGGMGCVFLARQTSLRRSVAIKAMRTDRRSTGGAEAFLGEAWVTGSLDHPNIVPIYDAAVDQNGAPFYAMRRIQGREWADSMPNATLEENIQILIRVGDALAYAHDQGVLHRDLKPANIMLGDYGEVLVLDWGLAAGISPTSVATPLDNNNVLAGTPCYLPPEAARGEPATIGIPSDVYLMGGILCEIISGRPPHQGETARDCLTSAAAGRIPSIECDDLLQEVLQKSLNPDPKNRYQSVKDLQDALRHWESHRRSLALSNEAIKTIQPANILASDNAYTDFTKAIATFELAVSEWPENVTAQKGLRDTRLAYARHAKALGDLELADAQLRPLLIHPSGPGDEARDLANQVSAERTARIRRKQQYRTMIGSIVGLVVILIAGLSTGYILVDNARSNLAKTNSELDAERATLQRVNISLDNERANLSKALGREEAANRNLDAANERLRIDNLAARLGIIANQIDEPAKALDDLLRIDDSIQHARAWPWRRLRGLISDVYTRFGGPRDQRLFEPRLSTDGKLIASLRMDGHIWLIPVDNPSTAVRVDGLTSAPWLIRWSSDNKFIIAGNLDGSAALISREGQVIFETNNTSDGVFGSCFGDKNKIVIIASNDRIAGYRTSDGSLRWEVDSVSPLWLESDGRSKYALVIGNDRRIWTLNARNGSVTDSTLRALPAGIGPGWISPDWWNSQQPGVVKRVAILKGGEEALILTEDRSVYQLTFNTNAIECIVNASDYQQLSHRDLSLSSKSSKGTKTPSSWLQTLAKGEHG